jgi:alkylation response protein AidB-like acyl-CoA dehydrogenase
MREFVENEIKPFIPKMEKEEAYPREIIRKLGQMGILGLVADEKHGGIGEEWVSMGIVIEEISKESNTLGLLVSLASDFGPGLIANVCTPEQVEKYIRPALRGDILMSGYCTEPCGIFNFPEYETTYLDNVRVPKANLIGELGKIIPHMNRQQWYRL